MQNKNSLSVPERLATIIGPPLFSEITREIPLTRCMNRRRKYWKICKVGARDIS